MPAMKSSIQIQFWTPFVRRILLLPLCVLFLGGFTQIFHIFFVIVVVVLRTLVYYNDSIKCIRANVSMFVQLIFLFHK